MESVNTRDLGGVIYIADPLTGTFVFIKLGHLKYFMSNECSMKCLWASENQRNWIFDIIYWALGRNQNHPNWNLANILAWKTNVINGLRYFIHFWKSFCLKLALNLSVLQTLHTTFVWHEIFQITWFYENKSACHWISNIYDTSKIPTKR